MAKTTSDTPSASAEEALATKEASQERSETDAGDRGSEQGSQEGSEEAVQSTGTFGGAKRICTHA